MRFDKPLASAPSEPTGKRDLFFLPPRIEMTTSTTTPTPNMLTTKRPTQTTVLYTVSTRSPNKTITSRLKASISLLIRLIAGLLVLACLLLEYHQIFNNNSLTNTDGPTRLQKTSALISSTSLGQYIKTIPIPYRFISILVTFWFIFRKSHTTESLLVIRGLGVQTTTSSPNYLWTGSTRFIPTNVIQDIFIHEAFEGFDVKYYLSIVVEGEEDVVVVFPVSRPSSGFFAIVIYILVGGKADMLLQSILPRREVLEQVWRGARACLYEPKSG